MNKFFQYGACYGKVSDNADPEGRGRVKVSLDSLGPNIVTDWIEILTDYTGNFFLPEVGEQVMVAFAGDNAERGVVIGSIWSNAQKPPVTGENGNGDVNKDGKNQMRYVKTKSGHMLVFDDTKGKEKLQMIASGGKTRMQTSAESKKMDIKSDLDIVIEGKKKLNIKGQEVKIESTKIFGVKGDETGFESKKGMNVKASKNLGLKGSGIALN